MFNRWIKKLGNRSQTGKQEQGGNQQEPQESSDGVGAQGDNQQQLPEINDSIEDQERGDNQWESQEIADVSDVSEGMDGYRLTVTHEGATAFEVDDPLVRLVFNHGSFLPESKAYYETQEAGLLRFIDAVTEAGRVHPELALQYAAWQRDPRKGKGNRSQTPWVLAALSALPECVAHPRYQELVAKCIVRPDDALNIIQASTVYLGDNQLPFQLKAGIACGLESMSDYQLAKYANTRLNLLPERREKSPENALPESATTAQELVPVQSEEQKIKKRTLRFVDVLGICKHYLSPRLFAVYRYLHAPTRQQPELLPVLEQHLPLLSAQKQVRVSPPQEISEVEVWFRRALGARMTMEQIFSATGMSSGERKQLRLLLAPPEEGPKEDGEEDRKPDGEHGSLELLQQHEIKKRDIRAEIWKNLFIARVADENNSEKMLPFLGDIAFMRNLRGMYQSGVPVSAMVQEAGHRRFAGLWPFQILSAANALGKRSTRGGKKYSAEPCPQVYPVMDTIFERAALNMLPRKQDGTLYKVLGLADTSGSMDVRVGSQNSTATCMDVAVSFSVAFSYSTRTSEFGGLAGTWGTTFYPEIAHSGAGPTDLARQVHISSGGGGGGTQVFGSMIALMNWLLEHPESPRPEVLVILSDMQFHPPASIDPGQLRILPTRYQNIINSPAFKEMPPLAAAIVLYREIFGSEISLVLWNLATYEGSPVPSKMDRVLMLSGFDTNSFQIMEQWLRAGSPGSAMPATPIAPGEAGTSGSSFEAVLAALRQY